MRLASIHIADGVTTAAVDGEEVIDLHRADPEIPADMIALLAGGDPVLERVRGAIDSGAARLPLDGCRLAAPVARPTKFFAVGLNYADHVAESGQPTPEHPTVFSKMPSCVVGPFDDVERPLVSSALDYEGELGFVIGRRCRHVSRDRAAEVIAGYVVINDVSVRDYQLRTPQWTLGKSFDTHGVVGPWIVTGDDLDPHALDIRTLVNGEVRQQSNTSNLIFDCFTQVELLSSVCTLEPGDIVATGTPGGVGIANDPPRWLVPGDIVRVEVESIGALENRIVDERPVADGHQAEAVSV
ncbi:MAG TPA: fumarylacetoacetate hydrolase family protein [Baekduia sp.]|nr:fumarylacetoacetate hydrolase family protein [Baekduia sp.]